MMTITINGKHIEVEGEYYAGYTSRNREEPNEPAEYMIYGIRLVEDFDEMTTDYFNNSLEHEQQLEFLGSDEYEIGELCLELIEEQRAEYQIDEYLEYYESRM